MVSSISAPRPGAHTVVIEGIREAVEDKHAICSHAPDVAASHRSGKRLSCEGSIDSCHPPSAWTFFA